MLEYEGDLQHQLERLDRFADQGDGRITLIDGDGRVVMDSDADASELDNHGDRKEVSQALLTGQGYAKRHSETLGRTMLYVACRSAHSDMVIRMAVPYYGMREYLPMLFPAAFLSFLIALGCSFLNPAACIFHHKTLK